jgi:choline dehydrogenase
VLSHLDPVVREVGLELAGPEWSFARLVEYVKRIERLEGAREANEGADGPVHIAYLAAA